MSLRDLQHEIQTQAQVPTYMSFTTEQRQLHEHHPADQDMRYIRIHQLVLSPLQSLRFKQTNCSHLSFLKQEAHRERRHSHRSRLSDDQYALLDSAKKKDVGRFKKLLSQGVDPDFHVRGGNSLVHCVTQSGSDDNIEVTLQMLRRLIYLGADVETCDRFGRTPLHLAAVMSPDLVQVFLEAGCSVNVQDNAGRTLLMEACSGDMRTALVIVQMLLDWQCNVHLQDQDGFTALHCICANSKQSIDLRHEICIQLLNHGLSVNTTDRKGEMAICLELNHLSHIQPVLSSNNLNDPKLDVVKTLLAAGSCYNHRNSQHERWLLKAAVYANRTFLKLLLSIAEPYVKLAILKHIRRQVFSSISDDSALCNMLRDMSCKVPSLKTSCRFVIRDQLRGKVWWNVHSLTLPHTLTEYIAFKQG